MGPPRVLTLPCQQHAEDNRRPPRLLQPGPEWAHLGSNQGKIPTTHRILAKRNLIVSFFSPLSLTTREMTENNSTGPLLARGDGWRPTARPAGRKAKSSAECCQSSRYRQPE